MVDEDTRARWAVQVEQLEKYQKKILQDLDLRKVKVSDPEGVGDISMVEWNDWALKRYNEGFVVDDDVGGHALKTLHNIHLHFNQVKEVFNLFVREFAVFEKERDEIFDKTLKFNERLVIMNEKNELHIEDLEKQMVELGEKLKVLKEEKMFDESFIEKVNKIVLEEEQSKSERVALRLKQLKLEMSDLSRVGVGVPERPVFESGVQEKVVKVDEVEDKVEDDSDEPRLILPDNLN